MGERHPADRAAAMGAGMAVGLTIGGAVMILLQVVAPAFVESISQLLTLVLIWAVVGAIGSLFLAFLSPQSAVAVTSGLLVMVAVFGVGKLIFPYSISGVLGISLVTGIAVGLGVRRWRRLPTKRIAVVGILVILIASGLMAFLSRDQEIDSNLVVVGLDAGTWTVLDELFESGDLPNLRQMVDHGVSGTLLSDEPTLSPRVWTTIATGKGPVKHGIADFFSTQSRDLSAARFWEILIRFDYSVGLFRWLVTWPPEPVGPFNVPGWMARDASTIPETLSFVKEVERKFQNDVGASLGIVEAMQWGALYVRAGVGLDTCLKVLGLATRQLVGDHPPEAGYATKRTMHDLLNMDVFLEQMKRHRPDVAAIVLYGSDNLAHKVWKYRYPEEFDLDPETRVMGDFLDNYYREADRFLGELRALVGDETTLLLISDHGYTTAEGDSEGPRRQTVFKPRMVKLLDFLGLATPDQATVASVSTRGYITFQGDSELRHTRLEETRTALGGVTVTGTGLPVFRLTRTDSEQLEVSIAKETDLDENTQVEVKGEILPLADLVEIEQRAGEHSVKGIIIAQGPDLRRDARIADSHLVDIAPTLLYLLGVPIAEDMDGRVLEEMIDEEFLSRNAIESVPSYDELVLNSRERGWDEGDEETLKKELEALGYLN